jgi:ArsR family transcriptional regulator
MLFHEIMKSQNGHACDHPHPPVPRPALDPVALERAAEMFRALGDPARLKMLHLLAGGESCVGELVEAAGEKFSTVSQRLSLLRAARLVTRRREKSHVFYALADDHVKDLVSNALAHAGEPEGGSPSQPEDGE